MFHTTEVANQMSWSKEELEAYDARGIYIQDERGRIEYVMEEGMKVRELEIARELKKNSVNIDIIVASTGLTKEEIENL